MNEEINCEYEWFKIGKEVYVTKKVLDNNSMKEAASLISETYCEVISKFTHNNIELCVLKNSNSAYTCLITDMCLSDETIIKSKPKPQEEELRSDIEHAIHHFEGDEVAGRKWLMSKYEIKLRK